MPVKQSKSQPVNTKNNVAVIDAKANALLWVTSFLEAPLTKKQFILTCAACVGAAYVYPKLSVAPILNLFKKKSDIQSDNDSELQAPVNSLIDLTRVSDGNIVSKLKPENEKDSSSDHISEEEVKSAEAERDSKKSLFQRMFR